MTTLVPARCYGCTDSYRLGRLVLRGLVYCVVFFIANCLLNRAENVMASRANVRAGPKRSFRRSAVPENLLWIRTNSRFFLLTIQRCSRKETENSPEPIRMFPVHLANEFLETPTPCRRVEERFRKVVNIVIRSDLFSLYCKFSYNPLGLALTVR